MPIAVFFLGYFLTNALINPSRSVGYLQSNNGARKKVKIGFSWTTLFFGFLTTLFRKDIKWTAIMLAVLQIPSFIPNMAFLPQSAQFIVIFLPLSFQIIFAFIYNKLYIKNLIAKGYIPIGDDFSNVLQQKGFSFDRYIPD